MLSQALTFAGAGLQQARQGILGQLQQGRPQILGVGLGLHGQLEDVGHAQTPRLGQNGLDLCLPLGQLTQQGGIGLGQSCLLIGFEVYPNFHFAALELGTDQVAQRGFVHAQLIGHAKAKVQKAAVDRADFQAQANRGCRRGGCGGRQQHLGAGVTSHAVNGHG